jgi:hypothetical protein
MSWISGSIKKSLFSKVKGQYSRFFAERLEPNPGANHLVAVLDRKKIITPDKIIQESLAELKSRIAAYFASDLERGLEEWVTKIEKMLGAIARNETR